MRLTSLKQMAFLAIAPLFSIPTFSQDNCVPTNINGAIINLACNQVCQNINFQIPHLKSSSTYSVNSIEYSPYPYVTPGGVVLSTLYVDDEFSSVISLPFPVCFYDSIYNSVVVGSNGVITFDVACANQNNAYTLTAPGNVPQPIPYNVGAAPTGIATTYYPRASIMGAYHDIYPTLSAGGQRRIEYSLVGTAPCRKFVVSYFSVPMFGSACNTLLCTQQIVLNENTGIVEVFIGDKPLCSSWNQGLAILGLQNWARNQAVAAPGKNCTAWSETNTGYRFTPSGGGSRYLGSQLFSMSGTLIATADTATTTAGLLDLNFPNVCPPPGNTQYRIVTSFSACTGPGTTMTTVDTITITRTNTLNATATSTNAVCGPPSGTITVTVPAGVGTTPYTFVLDGTVTQIGNSPMVFNSVTAGPHTVVITDASGGCTNTVNVTVNQNNNLAATITPTATSCPGVSNGTINITPTNGVAPYTFLLNPGAITQTGNTATFTGLASGPYTVTITDAGGCVTLPALATAIGAGSGFTATSSSTSTSCLGASNGTITVNPTSGTAPYTFVLNGTVTQTGPTTTFNGVGAGMHTITVTDASGCTINPALSVTVSPGPALAATFTQTATSCLGSTNGTATITPTNGTAPYTFVMDGTVTQTGATTVFNGLSAGPHSVVVTDASGCASSPIPITINAGPALVTTATHTDVLCNGALNGSITVAQPTVGTAPFQYSLDGVNWQSSNLFPGLGAGTYTVYYRESGGCQGQLIKTISQPAMLSATSSSLPATCYGQTNGSVTVVASGGTTPYQYSIDGGVNWQSSNSFNVGAGNFTITIRDANQCLATQTVTVTAPVSLIASAITTNGTCNGGTDGTITLSATGGNISYEYSLDGNYYQPSNVFNVIPGTYTATIKDYLGCQVIVPNIVVGLTNDLVFTPPVIPTICEGTSTILGINTNALQYSWSPATGLSSTTVSNPTANPTSTTTYNVKLTYGLCTADVPVTVNVNAAPLPNAGADGMICYGQNYQLQASGGVQFKWTPATYLDNTDIPNPLSTPDRTITYLLSVVDANGCQSLVADAVTVDVTPPIKVSTYPFDTVAYEGDQFQLLASSVATDYLWTPSIGLDNPNIPDPVLTAGQVGDLIVYKVTASTQAGCKGEGYVRLRVYKGPELFVPTGFTPNGDGRNDRFFPFPVGIKSIKAFKVFNRWGEMVFSTTTLHDGWDGKYGGREQATGVYVWIVEGVTLDGRIVTHKGTVTLIR